MTRTWRSLPEDDVDGQAQELNPAGLAVLPLYAAEDWRKLLRLVKQLDARLKALEASKEVNR